MAVFYINALIFGGQFFYCHIWIGYVEVVVVYSKGGSIVGIMIHNTTLHSIENLIFK